MEMRRRRLQALTPAQREELELQKTKEMLMKASHEMHKDTHIINVPALNTNSYELG